MTDRNKDLNEDLYIPCSMNGSIKGLILPELIYRFNAIPFKITMEIFITLTYRFLNLYENAMNLEERKRS